MSGTCNHGATFEEGKIKAIADMVEDVNILIADDTPSKRVEQKALRHIKKSLAKFHKDPEEAKKTLQAEAFGVAASQILDGDMKMAALFCCSGIRARPLFQKGIYSKS